MTTRTDELLVRLRVEADQALRGLKQVETQTKKTTAEFSKVGRNSRRLSSNLQNAGYQIQDFAVQVGSGTDALRAFSQQAPQLLGAFGGIGVAVGTAVAVLAPLAKVLLDSGKASKEASTALNSFDKALSDLSGGEGSLDKFVAALKEANAETRRLLAAEAGSTQNDLQRALDASTKAFKDQIAIATQWNGVVTGGFVNFAAVYDEISAIQDNLKVDRATAESISTLFDAFEDGSQSLESIKAGLLELKASGAISGDALKPIIDALDVVRKNKADLDSVTEGIDAIGSVSPELTGVDDLLESISYAAAGTVKPFNDMGKAALDAANPDEFEQLVSELGEVMRTADATAQAMSSLGNLADIGVTFGKGPKKDGEEIKTLLEELQTEAGKWADQFADTLVSGLAEGKLAFKDFADYILQQLARIALSKALEPLFNSFGDWIGGITGAAAPVPTGLIAVPANDLPISREMSAAQPMIVGVPRMSAPSSSSSPVTVNVYNQGSNEVEVNERKTTRGVEVDVLIKNAVKQGFAAGDFDKVMATSYGARRLAY